MWFKRIMLRESSHVLVFEWWGFGVLVKLDHVSAFHTSKRLLINCRIDSKV